MKVLLLGDRKLDNYKAVIEHLNVLYDTLDSMSDYSAYDSLIIPGGIDVSPRFYHEENDPTVKETDEHFDKIQMDAIKYFVDNKKPILGICRGMQLLNVYLKGSLIQDIKSNIEHRTPKHEDAYHEVNNSGFLKELYGEKARVNSEHHQAIKKIADGFEVMAKSDDGIIEAVKHKTLPIIGVQFHPERMSLNFKRDDCIDGIEIFKYFLQLK